MLQKLIESLRNICRGTQYQRLWKMAPFHIFRLTATFTCSLLLHVSSTVHSQDERSNYSTRLVNITVMWTSFSDDQEQASHLPTIIKKLKVYIQTMRSTPSAHKLYLIAVKVTQPPPKFCKDQLPRSTITN